MVLQESVNGQGGALPTQRMKSEIYTVIRMEKHL